MIVPWCGVGKHAIPDDAPFRLVAATCTVPPQPPGGFPRGSTWSNVGWYPYADAVSALLVCAEHDINEWAAAPTYDRR